MVHTRVSLPHVRHTESDTSLDLRGNSPPRIVDRAGQPFALPPIPSYLASNSELVYTGPILMIGQVHKLYAESG